LGLLEIFNKRGPLKLQFLEVCHYVSVNPVRIYKGQLEKLNEFLELPKKLFFNSGKIIYPFVLGSIYRTGFL